MKVIAISGNPVVNGTVDKLTQLVLDGIQSNDKEIVYLRDFDIKPCKACLGCTDTNECVQNDDWIKIENKIKKADVMVLGVPTYYGAAFGINALTHNFLERWFALRHQGVKTNIKKVILAVVTGEEQDEFAINSLKTFFNVYHNIEVVDTVVARGTTPCYKCGFGEKCPLSVVIARYGQGVKITCDMVPPLEKQVDMQKIEALAEKLYI